MQRRLRIRKGACVRHITWLFPASVVLVVVLGILSTHNQAAAADRPAPIAVYSLGSLPDAQFDKGAWSESGTENGVAFRKAWCGRSPL
jgi:hypothetical protein